MIGDIVTINGRAGKWVVLGQHEHGVPAQRLWRVRHEGTLATDLVVGDGDLNFVEHPLYAPDQVVRFDHSFDGKATVISDDGPTMRIRYVRQRRRILRGEKWGSTSYQFDEGDIDRGSLVAMNM